MWRRTNDSSLGNVLVELSSEDEAPVLARTPATLTPSVTQGGNAASQTFEVWNSGGGIGRASCRDRVKISVVAVSLKKKTWRLNTHTKRHKRSGPRDGHYKATRTNS